MSENMIPLMPENHFRFSCHPDVPCFNDCCRDLNQLLTPYDIVCIKNRLEMDSADFLKQYTTRHVGPRSGFPIISLKSESRSDMTCPFVSPKGCKIYEDRPASCRIYPLARAVSKSRGNGKMRQHYALMKEPHCLGFASGRRQTVLQWVADQGLEIHNQVNDLLLEVISLKNQRVSGPLDLKYQHFFYLACYDLDTFKTHVFEKGLLDADSVTSDVLKAARTDDIKLLMLGIQWIKGVLFET